MDKTCRFAYIIPILHYSNIPLEKNTKVLFCALRDLVVYF
jgi:hypothetical protein